MKQQQSWWVREDSGALHRIPLTVGEMRDEIAACGFAVPVPATAVNVSMRAGQMTWGEPFAADRTVVEAWQWMRDQQVERDLRGGR